MTKKDEKILEIYMHGFNDELNGRVKEWESNSIWELSYNLGRMDAIIGDDVSSNDLQTSDEIINKIKEDFINKITEPELTKPCFVEKRLNQQRNHVLKLANDVFKGCDGCTSFEETMWKEGFIRGYYAKEEEC